MASDACHDCGAARPRWSIEGTALCDTCANQRIAEITGTDALPEPQGPFVLHGPDGRRHDLRARFWRAATGIVVELEEVGMGPDEGYRFSVLGAHDADLSVLTSLVLAQAEREIDHPSLELDPHRGGWTLAGDEVVGRFEWDDDQPSGAPFAVVVDGHRLTWNELGEALSSLEGWRFRLLIEERSDDARPEGYSTIVEVPDHSMRLGDDG